MACVLGVHFAITAEQESQLLAADSAGDTEALEALLEEIEEGWPYGDDDLKVDTDKEWDAIHRCLGDGTLDPDAPPYPLSHAVLGGRQMHDDYYVCYVSPHEVREVAAALHQVDEARLRHGFESIGDDYLGPLEFDYTWSNFLDVRAFFDRAAEAKRAVIFTAT
jgi:Domain of unknown function (DUF1877)